MSSILLTTDDLQRWREELAEIDAEIARLAGRRTAVERLLDAASILAGHHGGLASKPPDEIVAIAEQRVLGATEMSEATPADEDEAVIDLKDGMSWNAAVQSAVYAYPSGVVSHVLKDRIRRSPLGPRLDASDKGYYNAIGRLAHRGAIRKHNGRLFSPEAYDAYMQAVGQGEIEDTTPPPATTYSPMGNRIEEIIAVKPGIKSSEIIQELQCHPEFAAMLTPRPTVAYNIIARLKNRQRIRKKGDGLYPFSPQSGSLGPEEPSDPKSHNGGRDGTLSSSGNGRLHPSVALPGARPAQPGE